MATTLPPNDPRVSRPLFTVNEVARYLNVPHSTLWDWAHPAEGEAYVTILDRGTGYEPTVPFIGFAEAFVLQAARRAGVPKWRLLPNVIRLREAYPSVDHLLASRRVYTDGAEILVRVDAEDSLEVPRLGQRQLTETVRNQLQQIEYANDGYARRLSFEAYEGVDVAFDPLVAAGRPMVAGARVKDLVDRYRGGDSEKTIASAFGIPVRTVRSITRHA